MKMKAKKMLCVAVVLGVIGASSLAGDESKEEKFRFWGMTRPEQQQDNRNNQSVISENDMSAVPYSEPVSDNYEDSKTLGKHLFMIGYSDVKTGKFENDKLRAELNSIGVKLDLHERQWEISVSSQSPLTKRLDFLLANIHGSYDGTGILTNNFTGASVVINADAKSDVLQGGFQLRIGNSRDVIPFIAAGVTRVESTVTIEAVSYGRETYDSNDTAIIGALGFEVPASERFSINTGYYYVGELFDSTSSGVWCDLNFWANPNFLLTLGGKFGSSDGDKSTSVLGRIGFRF